MHICMNESPHPTLTFSIYKDVISKVSFDNKRAASQKLQTEIMSSWICTCSCQICGMEETSSLNLLVGKGGGRKS
jgi:hypothetical protein